MSSLTNVKLAMQFSVHSDCCFRSFCLIKTSILKQFIKSITVSISALLLFRTVSTTTRLLYVVPFLLERHARSGAYKYIIRMKQSSAMTKHLAMLSRQVRSFEWLMMLIMRNKYDWSFGFQNRFGYIPPYSGIPTQSLRRNIFSLSPQ